ncbi:MAG: hypothetical protein F6K22_00745 [Okeania sp. SIO2F4]|uniref:hypothetical protein n=1 Tax=Okeania sp. SIO2F4 TaxID=2607790 RepID=UPI00142BAE71|nr:hypothetical protein [Okeania sp. SIO2F4]NES01495.1 hypothetical protein [Okeania sp. SIO2F4]
MNEPKVNEQKSPEKVKLSINIDPGLLDQVKHLTNDPSKVIESALRQWLRGGLPEDELALTLQRNPPLPPRGEWND